MNILVSSSGTLKFNNKEFKCALGKGGVSADKKEGDGATPVGCFEIREIWYRADKIQKPESPFETKSLSADDGWCDDIKDSNYNKHVLLPYEASHESLWREDNLYDIIVVLGYNDKPPVVGKGSAIFMHIARPAYSPTAGCIALSESDLREILSQCSPDTQICIDK